jgi:hypothetical protein
MTRPAVDELIWGYLLHLSYNMWADRDAPEWGLEHVSYRPHLRYDAAFGREVLQRLAEAGANMVVLDLGDAVRYASHPEIAVSGAWEPERLRAELAWMRGLGLEVIPKLNFSTSHDAWLGPYARMVSTPVYYDVCRDLIRETLALFDRPRFFHLGMDEETAQHQRYYAYAVMRQYDLWWHDLFFYVNQMEEGGSRAWVWSDYVWHHPELFYANMPADLLQSNWYYDNDFSTAAPRALAYNDLEAHGYDQVPTGSNWRSVENLPLTVVHSFGAIAPERLKGFLQTVWKPTLPECREQHLDAITALAAARTVYTACAKAAPFPALGRMGYNRRKPTRERDHGV